VTLKGPGHSTYPKVVGLGKLCCFLQ